MRAKKYIVVLGDGMADYPVAEFGGKTVLETAHKPNMDEMARYGEMGLVQTVLPGMKPGSDVANLSVMGYDTRRCYSGRSPLEAASMGVALTDTDVTFRTNLVTLSQGLEYSQKTMLDYSAGEISTEEAKQLIAAVEEALHTELLHFYPGVSYRHLLVWHGGSTKVQLTPPHDISDQKITDYLPKGEGAPELLAMMQKSEGILKNHPVNQARIAAGKNPATSIWIWGEGTKPDLENFYEKYGKRASVISAVDLIKGIAKCAGMLSIDVPGATGNYDTNFAGKAQAALDTLLDGQDLVYVHLEAPDECGHQGDAVHKKYAVEMIDEKIIGFLRRELEAQGIDYKMLVLPDHPTPIRLKTHVSDPVPYVIYDSASQLERQETAYTEKNAEAAGRFIAEGHSLMAHFLED